MEHEDHNEQASPPERVARCLVALQEHGYSVKERRYGWLVTEPLGGRLRIESLERLEEYTAQKVKMRKQVAARNDRHEVTAGQYAVEDIEEVERVEDKSAEGRRNLKHGVIYMAIGVIVTVVTYDMAEPGGTYILAWGAMAGGLVLFIAGVFQLAKERRRRE